MKDKKQSKEMEPRGGQAGQPPCGQLTTYLVFVFFVLSFFVYQCEILCTIYFIIIY